MNANRSSMIRKALIALALYPLAGIANEGEKPVAAPLAPHQAPGPVTHGPEASAPPTPATAEPETPKTEEPSGKGLVVNRAPDFCMKKDPPPHCTE